MGETCRECGQIAATGTLTDHLEDGLCFPCWLKEHPPTPAFGSTMRQPEGLNPPPLELRSPEPRQGQLI